MSESYERIEVSTDAGVATVMLNRPAKRNALDDVTIAELRDAFEEAELDEEVRVVVLRGAGTDFCAGADLSQLEMIASQATVTENLDDASALGALFVQMRRHSRPIVAAVQGRAFAGGAGLASACDIVLARQDALFGYPEVHLGFVPAMVMALLRRSCGEKVAFELVSRGDPVPAIDARHLGLVNRVLPTESFDADVQQYACDLAARSPSALRLTKRLLYGMDGLSFEEAIARGAEVNVLARMTDDCQEGVQKFLARKKS